MYFPFSSRKQTIFGFFSKVLLESIPYQKSKESTDLC
ncbi:hypothetical protein M7I_1768 [Glarea lozoyensis 74030]|uniref:Uncharacterized protein n=1 Tax=Glarea lozoyensis (strain ATCC 74030 / MF5533) TaxID=1104152 RepID=H0EH33_GLAL7|nr:hypothetical protein M7I_1768 [Glarea lozoyensis 74030]